jgi:hypothetical protein
VCVCVPAGTAEGGHYFSYIRESREDVLSRLAGQEQEQEQERGKEKEKEESGDWVERSRRWVEFNDTQVLSD